MAHLGEFNPDAVEDEVRELLPPGVYTAQIIESDLTATKTGTGQMLKLTFEIIEGACAKRRVWDNLNISNANAQAQEIAQRSLKRICTAIGHAGVLTDSEQLHFKPLRIRLSVEEDKSGQYAPQNRVKGYEALGGARPDGAAPADKAYTPPPAKDYAAASGGTARPWR